MGNPITHLVVNYVRVEENMIHVGATDNERWRWDTEEGESGADAKTIVFVTLTDQGKGYTVAEEAGFRCAPGDPTRVVAMSYLLELFEMAWYIKNNHLDDQAAREKYFGSVLNKATNTH
ncbi:MAG: hypothetical protein AAF734_11265 [Bacteroidota bacterium]